MQKKTAWILALLFASAMVLGCSPYRVKKRAPQKTGISILDFRKAHCGCGGK